MQFALNDYKNELLCSESIDTCSRVPIPKINDNENYIFISYSHKDYKYVFSDLADMYSSKVRFWYDKGLTAGKSWDDEVADIIEDSRCVGVVFYLSENFFLSDSIFREVQFVCEVKRKNFFCVNLTTDNIESLIDRNVLENERKAFYHQHFQQKKTYLVYKSVDHYHELIEQIANQYNVVSNKIEFENGIYHGALVNGRRNGHGVCIYSDGSRYDGEWENDKWNGYGEYLYSNGDIYRGNWMNGERHGDGELTLVSSGESYKGSYKEGLFDGYGIYRWENAKESEKKEYCGYYCEGKHHGKGKMIYADGSYYDGEWVDGKKQGHGTNTYSSGAIYIGEFHNNKRNGKGKYTYTNGDIYDGEWLKGDRTGNGTMNYANGDIYTGKWGRNKYNGYGTYIWANPQDNDPEKYEGYFLNGERDGQGRITYPGGGYYDGNWKQGWRSGYGECLRGNGDKYCGEWLKGDYHGKGTMLYANGDKYEGEWKHSEKNGNGVVTYADGQKFEGIWENDKEFEGNGYCQYDDSYYIGEIKNGKRNGYGTYVWLNANTANKEYSGEWLDGNYHGKGVMLYRNGDKYDGEWVKNNKEGQGIMQYANGDTYSGGWLHDQKHGIGEFYWESPARTSPKKHNGNYENDVICGHGSMMYANGDTYEGEFLDGKRNGTGTYKWYQNTIEKEYTGQWLAGEYHGNGTMIYSNGDKFEGEWKNNKKEGHGIYTYANGLSFEGTWENDSFYGVDGLHKSIGYIVRFVDNIYAWRIPFYLVFALSCVGIYSDFFEYKFFEFFNFQDIGLQMDYLGIHVLYQCICMIGISIILLLMHKSTVYNKWYYCAIVCSGSVFILGFGFYCIGMLLHMNAYAIVFMGVLYPLYVFCIGHFMTCLIRYLVFKLLKFNKSKKEL